MGGLGGLFNNPQMQQMASQMMSDPNIQNMMGQMMGAFSGGQQQPGAAPNAGGGLENLMRVGEQIAETLSQQNPELVEQLRQQFNNARGPSSEQNDGNHPPPSNQ
ncbi:Small glutamine-rich tetratricopeptide repeat-containing protein A [Aphelenchoides bicaudatus]|nr:Small glutamine-rich tetratricopeptide repeat-containing protein A [Aphelenchoides bicaudatus]